MRCVVVGAGILGASTALALCDQGAEVTLVDAGQPAGRATGNSFAWVAASHPALFDPEDYFRLNVDGMAAYRALEARTGPRPWLVRTGCLTWATSAPDQQALSDHASRLRGRGYAAETLSPAQVVRDLEPGALIPEDVESVAFFPDEGFVHGVSLVGELLAMASERGLVTCCDDAVIGLTISGGRVVGAALASGARLEADVVVSACGADTNQLIAPAGLSIPLISPQAPASPAVGLLVITSPLIRPVGRIVYADDMMIRPDGGGRLLLHGYGQDTLVTASTPVTPPPAAANEVLCVAGRHVRMPDARVEAARIGVRPLTPDELPAVGWARAVDGLYVLVSHSGMTVGLVLGRLAAQEVLGQEQDERLGKFRPQRFVDGAPSDQAPR